MKKKVIVLSMTFMLVCALVGGASYAWFTDSSTNSTTQIAAGTVDIDAQRNSSDPVPGPMFYTTLSEGTGEPWQTGYDAPQYPTGQWKPGDSHLGTMTVRNVGTLPVRLTKIGAAITGDSIFLADSVAVDQFSQYLNVQVICENGTDHEMYNGPLSGLLVDGGVGSLYVPSMGTPRVTVTGITYPTQHIRWVCTLSKSAGNPLQGKNPKVSFYVVASQAD